jgi:hypothetical protein
VVDLDLHRKFKATASNLQKELRAEEEPPAEGKKKRKR